MPLSCTGLEPSHVLNWYKWSYSSKQNVVWHPLDRTFFCSFPSCLFLTKKCAICKSCHLTFQLFFQRLGEYIKHLQFLTWFWSPLHVNRLSYWELLILFVAPLSSSEQMTMLFAADPMTTEFLDSLLPGALSKALQKDSWVTWTSFTSGRSSLTPSKNCTGLPLSYAQLRGFGYYIKANWSETL